MKNLLSKKRSPNKNFVAYLVFCIALSGCYPSVSYDVPRFEEFKNVFVINSESKNCPFVASFQGSRKGYDIFNPVQELGIKRDGFWIGFNPMKGQKMSVLAVSSCDTKLEISQYENGKLIAKKLGQGLAYIKDDSLLGLDAYEIKYSGTASFDSSYTISNNIQSEKIQTYRNQTPPTSTIIEKTQGFSLTVITSLKIQGALKVEVFRNEVLCSEGTASGMYLTILTNCPSLRVVN